MTKIHQFWSGIGFVDCWLTQPRSSLKNYFCDGAFFIELVKNNPTAL